MRKFKRRFVCGLLFSWLIFSGSNAAAQDPMPALRQADHLFAGEHYNAALTEYWRFIFFAEDHPLLFYGYYRAGISAGKMAEWNEAAGLLQEALNLAPSAELKVKIRYQMALALLAAGQSEWAKVELFKIAAKADNPAQKQAAGLLLAAAHFRDKQYTRAKEVLDRFVIPAFNSPDSSEKSSRFLDSLIQRLTAEGEPRSPRTAKWLSTFLPGAGQIYAGRWLDGLNALALNAATSYFLWGAVERKNIRDSVLIFYLLWWRYYGGNRSHAARDADSFNREHRERLEGKAGDYFQKIAASLNHRALSIELADIDELIQQDASSE